MACGCGLQFVLCAPLPHLSGLAHVSHHDALP